jgi:NTE family protein
MPMRKRVALALQGGGSHGAFTWGVLDRLLEDDQIEIEGISGASAGAMNAVMLAYGFAIGGAEGARQALEDFWETVARTAPFALLPGTAPSATNHGLGTGTSPALNTLLFLGRFFSPAQLNPFDLNPLRTILLSQIDFERLRRESKIKLFIAATDVASGRLRLFRNVDLTLKALLASACLPTLHHPIEIDGKAYWDGALAANPPLYPLVHKCDAHDVVAVLLQPWRQSEAPIGADEIGQRLTEIGFVSTFLSQFHGLMLAKEEAEREAYSSSRFEQRLRRLNIHIIDDQELMSRLSAGSKLNTHPAFIRALRDSGRKHAQLWLERKFPRVGARSSRHVRFLPDHPTMFPA